MSTTPDFDRLARAWLDDGPTHLSDWTLDAALEEVHLTRQRRALRVPWRFPTMPALSRATGIAAALVAVVGAGTFWYLTSDRPGSVGSQPTASPTAAPTVVPTAAPTLHPGIPGWASYTSAVYGFTVVYPSDWLVYERARQKAPARPSREDLSYADKFVFPQEKGEDEIGLLVWQMPAPEGLYVGSDKGGLNTSFATLCDSLSYESCGVLIPPKKLCLGPLGLVESQPGCVRTLIGSIGNEGEESPHAFAIDPKTGVVTVFWVAREDSFPTAERYGGATALLMAIVNEFKVE